MIQTEIAFGIPGIASCKVVAPACAFLPLISDGNSCVVAVCPCNCNDAYITATYPPHRLGIAEPKDWR
ncbi:MAG: hypothetical protein IPN98_17155 [Propionivibrio sp.]|nr:hypothetical protein [Propionivibrio sp.]